MSITIKNQREIADQIVRLKQKMQTENGVRHDILWGSLPGGMSLEIQNKITSQAEFYGLDPIMMLKFAAMESSGNPNAISSSGAIGLFQFTGSTASQFVRDNRASISLGIQDRFDIDQNIAAGMALTKENTKYLINAKLPLTTENIYLVHQLGPSYAVEVIRAGEAGLPLSDLSDNALKAMSRNVGKNAATPAAYVEENRKALEARYLQVVKRDTND